MARITIPYLAFKRLASGAIAGYWEPSPALRKAGWTRLALGADQKTAIAAAERRNEEVAAWRAGGARPKEVKRIVAPHTMAALIARFEGEAMDDAVRSARFEKPLSKETKRQYRFAFRQIERWAEAGRTPIAAIQPTNIEVLKAALLTTRNGDGEVKRHRAAAILRMLRMLLEFAKDRRLIVANPMDRIAVPSPAPRSRIIRPDAIAAIVAAAQVLGRPDVELGVLLGLWTLQREADILKLNRVSWRECVDMAPADRRVLAGADGRVLGFRLRQGKTAKWVEIPALPPLRQSVEVAFAANAARDTPIDALVADPDEARGTPQWKFQRGFRAAAEAAIARAKGEGDDLLVEELTGIQFRDLRRTGMCMMRDLGLTVLFISTLSGHSIDATTKILETYMPADTRTAAAAMAMLAIRLNEREAEEKRHKA